MLLDFLLLVGDYISVKLLLPTLCFFRNGVIIVWIGIRGSRNRLESSFDDVYFEEFDTFVDSGFMYLVLVDRNPFVFVKERSFM